MQVILKNSMFGFACPAGLDHQPKEDSTVKKPAKPRSIEARTVRPSMFGFARPAGLDHQPKEDSTVKKPAKSRSIEARTVRPSMFGFARPAGPDHGPKEDNRVKLTTGSGSKKKGAKFFAPRVARERLELSTFGL